MKKLKQLMLTLLIVVLSATLMIGGSGLSAFAALAPNTIIGNSVTNIVNDDNASAINLPKSVRLGEKIYVGNFSSASVKLPNGTIVNPTKDGSNYYVKATMLGNYIVSYVGANNKTYQYSVNCKLDKELEFRVDNDGATIPTYIKAASTKFVLPKAYLYEKNDETGEFDKIEDTEYSIFLNNKKINKDEELELATGTHVIQYYATYEGGKNFSKEYTVKAQKNFSDTVSPTMSISGIPTEASLNTKITLPKATTSDDYDQNVEVKISIKHDNVDVAEVVLDEYGYAKEYKIVDENTVPVTFDNINNMSFYPHKPGIYKVVYQAYDDAGNTSVKHPHDIDVLDKTAPRLEKIADDQIPERWGRTIDNATDKNTSKTIIFPMPEYSDNDVKENIQVSFEIRDTVNNNTVIKFSDIYKEEGSKYTYDSESPSKGMYKGDTDGKAEFKATGFEFDFSRYSIGSDPTPTGKYTAIYQARDGKPNITTKSYDITLDAKFDDSVKPFVEFDTEGDYLFVTEEDQEYRLPFAKVSDTVDARPTIDYTLKTTTLKLVKDNNLTNITLEDVDNNAIKVENGAMIKINNEYIEYDDQLYKYTGDLNLTVVGKDDVGNSNDDTATITIVSANDVKNNINLSIDSTKLNDTLNTDGIDDTADDEFVLGTKGGLNLGSLTINKIVPTEAELVKKYRKFAGFELSLSTVVDGKDVLIDGLSLETYFKDGAMHVNKLNFTPSKAGTYTLTVRAFDVSGRSVIAAYDFKVKSGATTQPEISANPIPTSGNVNVSYQLQNEAFIPVGDIDDARRFIARRIENAGKFSLMGTEFTAYTAGRYTFTDGYYTKADAPGEDSFKAINKAYSVKIDETSNPVFTLLDRMPTHIAVDKDDNDKDVWEEVKLPQVIANTEYSNAIVDITVNSPSKALAKGTELEEYTETVNGIEVTGYKFTPSEHGEYTVTYTASVGGSSKTTQSYTIKIGDTVPPSFELIGSHTKSVKQDAKFEFLPLSYLEENIDKKEDVTFTKKLIDPSGEVVYTSSSTGTTGAEKKFDSTNEPYEFTKTGSYTVEYTATDKVGNYSKIIEKVNVTATGGGSAVPLKVVRTVLIIVGVVLIGGVLLYFVRYRKARSTVRK